jgi:hypothetical protein
VPSDEVRQGTERAQSLIPCRHAAAALLFHIAQELPHPFGREVEDGKPVDILADRARQGRQQQA